MMLRTALAAVAERPAEQSGQNRIIRNEKDKLLGFTLKATLSVMPVL